MRAHQASRTAIKIARVVVYVAADPRRGGLLPAGAAEITEALLQRAGVLHDWQLRAYHSRRVRSAIGWMEHRLLDGQSTHVALRKRVFDDEVRAAIEAGAVQVLVVGAGFDTLAFRLARAHGSVRFVEIDHPATQSLKRHALEELGPHYDWPANLELQPADLGATPLTDVLDELGWDRRARSVVVAEGLLMYLGEHEVADFLRGVAARQAPGSRLLGTYLVPDAEGRPTLGKLGGLTRASLRAIGEPLRWATTPEELATLLEDTGFAMRDDPGRVDLRLRYLVPAGLDDLPLPTHERVLMADRR
jgi:methyltransferase (TIGR00027 family)